jgi:hypothetical protein
MHIVDLPAVKADNPHMDATQQQGRLVVFFLLLFLVFVLFFPSVWKLDLCLGGKRELK